MLDDCGGIGLSKGFSTEFIEKLKSNNDIVTTASRYINLQRKGKNWWACCPFHNERTPSFAINEYEQFFHCFSCGASGDVIMFVEKIESLDFYDACRKLCEYAHMEMPEFTDDEALLNNKKKRDRLYKLLQETALYYYNNLKTDLAKPALSYMSKRKLDLDTIKSFGLGYSLGWNEVIDYLSKKGYTIEEMMSAGVVEKNDKGNHFDAYAKRLIFPIFNVYGNVVGFSARLLEAKPDFAKYKNTSQTMVFDKSRCIYGINQIKALKKTGDIKEIIIVEGQMDVISLYKSGVKNAVACMGTALTPNHARDLKRFTDKIVLCFDGDGAGIKATLRSIDILVEAGLNVYVVTIPNKQDPDEYINEYGKDKFDSFISSAKYWVEFLINYEASIVDLSKREEKNKFVVNALRIIKKLETDSERDIYIKLVKDISHIAVDSLKRDLNNTKVEKNDKPTEPNIDKIESTSIVTRENAYIKATKFVLAALLYKKPYAVLNDSIYSNLIDNDYKRLYEYIVDVYNKNEKPIVSHLFDMFDDAENNATIMGIVNYIFNELGDNEKYYLDCVKILVKNGLTIRQESLMEQLHKTTDTDERRNILKEIQLITSELKRK